MSRAPNSIFANLGTTIFEVMSALAREHDAINLGQGFPEEMDPADVREKAADAVVNGWNQYPPMFGLPELRQAVAENNKRFYGLEVDWQKQVLVTSGATEALAACLFSLIEPGDEVVLIEPLYDCYLPIVRRAGGVAKLVRIEPPDWELPRAALREAFSEKTKLILLNTPNNPAAKVFTREELQFVAGLMVEFDTLAVLDEVYEHLVFDERAHVSMMALPEVADRCVRIGSAGKTFSLTGWKVGYITAAPELMPVISKCHQYLVFTTPPNLQAAVAYGLAKPDSYFTSLRDNMQAKRDRFAKGLAEIGFETVECHGTYFISADFRPLGFNGDDVDFCRHITEQARVAAVPVSAFYEEDGPRYFARFSFCKPDAMLDEAVERLASHFKG